MNPETGVGAGDRHRESRGIVVRLRHGGDLGCHANPCARSFHLAPGSFWYGFSVASALVGTFLGAVFAGAARRSLRLARHAQGSRRSCTWCRRWAARSAGTSSRSTCSASSADSRSARRRCSRRCTSRRSRRPIVAASSRACSSSTSCSASCSRSSSNALVQQLAGGADPWRLKLGVAAVPALFFLVMMYTIPQSPRWLAQRGRRDEAKASLARVGVADGDAMLAEFERAAETARRKSGAGAVRRRVSQAHPARDPDRSVQPALGHQRHPVLPQGHLRGRGLQSACRNDLQQVAVGAANLHRDHLRPAGHRSRRAQEAAADRLGGHGAGAGRCRGHHGHGAGHAHTCSYS